MKRLPQFFISLVLFTITLAAQDYLPAIDYVSLMNMRFDNESEGFNGK
ncbi:MAG: hypothetical protein ABI550_02095 [Ignavibacteriaceae bacterium]